MAKRKNTKRKTSGDLGGRREDKKQRRKHAKGGRIEAYTFGEALGKKRWP